MAFTKSSAKFGWRSNLCFRNVKPFLNERTVYFFCSYCFILNCDGYRSKLNCVLTKQKITSKLKGGRV